MKNRNYKASAGTKSSVNHIKIDPGEQPDSNSRISYNLLSWHWHTIESLPLSWPTRHNVGTY